MSTWKTKLHVFNSPVITFCLYSASQMLVERTAACLTSFSSFCDILQCPRSIRTHNNAHIRSIKACPPRTLKTFAIFATLVKKAIATPTRSDWFTRTKLPQLRKMRDLDAKRINNQNEKNELRSVLEWYPAANDVGEMFSYLTPVNTTLPAFESTLFLYLLG